MSFHLENVNFESLNDIYDSKFSIEWNRHVLGWRPQPSVSSLHTVVGYAALVAAVIPDAMLLPIEVTFVQEVQLPVHDGLACP